MAAKCDDCGKLMDGGGCSHTHISLGSEVFPRVPHDDMDDPCWDCGAYYDQCHHFGCDREVCPKCFGQVAFCDCGVRRDVHTLQGY